MRQPLILLCFLAAMSSCNPLETVENKDPNGVVTERFTKNKKTGLKEGAFIAFFPNGKPSEEGFYKNDFLDGEHKTYYESGQLESVEHLQMGRYEGKSQKFFENGKPLKEFEYLNNEIAGTMKVWYESGELKEEVTFAHNEENGLFKEYHQNGKIKTEGLYKNGDNENGELRKYDESGMLTEKMLCRLGVCQTSWTKEKGDIPVDTIRMNELVEKLRMLNAADSLTN